jgi:hypothetical protein
MTRRERPDDGGMLWHAHLHAFECLGCLEHEEVHSRTVRDNPELLRRRKELLILDHTECWEFNDAEMARRQRRYRKRQKREQNLAKQRTSYTGGRF